MVTGEELRINERNEPNSTYVILALTPLRDTFRVKESFEIKLDLDDITDITRDRRTKEIAERLKKMQNTSYSDWVELAREMFNYLMKEFHHKHIKLAF